MSQNRRESVTAVNQNKSPVLRRRSTVQFDTEALARRRSTVAPANYGARRRSSIHGLARRPSKPVPLTEEQRKKLARDRFRKAVFKVKAMIRFGFPMRTKAAEETKPKPKYSYENTYKLEPDCDQKFSSEKATKNMKLVMDDNLRTYKYNRFSAPNFSRALSTMIVDKMKELDYPRYKYVCNVIIGEQKGQNFDFGSRCVWNDSTDTSATARVETATFFAVATVHAIYLD